MSNPKGAGLLVAGACALIATGFISTTAHAQNERSARAQQVIDHWTPARRAAATPRDLRIDNRGLGYMRGANGSLTPYGHQIQAEGTPAPNARPPGGGGGGGNNDSEPPQISNLDPATGDTIGDSHTFSATVTDNVGVKSVTFIVTYPDGTTTQNFSASNTGGDTWSTTLSGFTDGNWSWQVSATDTAKRGGNSAVSDDAFFTVSTGGGGGGGGGGGDTITNAQWPLGGDIQEAQGRLFYEMPSNQRRKRWNGYVCSGTVITDGVSGRSIILTAAHCVYDDANKAFARNVLFIPNQNDTTGSGTDSNCSNDPIGCWVATFGVVDVDWTTRTFPDNIPWDYAYYVVEDGSGSHQPGYGPSSDTLDQATPAFGIQFSAPAVDDGTAGAGTIDYTHALGYSYSDDPNFMYCAEDMTTEGTDNWWLPSCGLSGGSSGGSWIQPMSGTSGPIISVNSWGYTTSPGMAGPKLNGTSANCVLNAAALTDFANVPQSDGDAGVSVNCN